MNTPPPPQVRTTNGPAGPRPIGQHHPPEPPSPKTQQTDEDSHVRIVPWDDPLLNHTGYDPRGWYFERYWLSVVGPTASFVMRRFADLLDEHPDGCTVNLVHTAQTMGLSASGGSGSAFGRAVQRCVMFGLARRLSDGFAVRRAVPPIATRHLRRLPADVQAEHDAAVAELSGVDRSSLASTLTAGGLPRPLAVRAVAALRAAS